MASGRLSAYSMMRCGRLRMARISCCDIRMLMKRTPPENPKATDFHVHSRTGRRCAAFTARAASFSIRASRRAIASPESIGLRVRFSMLQAVDASRHRYSCGSADGRVLNRRCSHKYCSGHLRISPSST